MIKLLKFTFVASLLAAPVFSSAATWDGGGADTDYSNGLNWNPDGVPGAGTDAEILQNVNVALAGSEASGGILRVQNAAGASLSVNAGGALLSLNRIRIGEAAGTSGTVTLSGGDITLSPTGQSFIGSSGAGVVNVQAGSTLINNAGQNVVLGGFPGGSGTLNVTGGTYTDSNANTVVGRDAPGFLNVSSGSATVRNLLTGNLPGGSGVVTISGTGTLNASSLSRSIIGQSGTGVLNISDDGTFTGAGTRDFSLGNANGGRGTANISGNGTLSLGGAIYLAQTGGGAQGTIVQSGGLVESRSSNIVLGRQGNGRGTYILSGGTVSANSTLFVGRAGTSVGVFDQSGGDVFVGNSLEFGTVATASGTYTMTAGSLRVGSGINAVGDGNFVLNGGTLRVDSIAASLDSFTWGAGTLASTQEADFGNIVANIDLSTTSGSVLDIGAMYVSGVLAHETLTVNGTLDLTAGGDVLDAIGTVNLLRPSGTGRSDFGSINLVSATLLNGTFDTFLAPSDGINQSLFDPGGDPNALDVNTWFLEYDTVNNQINFLYKVSGVAPEPTTVSLLGVALVILRGIRRKRYTYDA